MFLFDTDIISNLICSSPSAALIRRIAATPPGQQFTTSVTAGELACGAYRSGRAEYFLAKVNEQVLAGVTVLSFDQEAAEIYGKIRAELERAGTPLPEPDLRIAAIALARSLTVITGDVRHFTRVPGLRVENWL